MKCYFISKNAFKKLKKLTPYCISMRIFEEKKLSWFKKNEKFRLSTHFEYFMKCLQLGGKSGNKCYIVWSKFKLEVKL